MPKYAPIKKFITHTGEVVEGDRLKQALNHVADFWVSNAHGCRKAPYASHVTEQQKDDNLARGLEYAESIRQGYVEDFTSQQRINTYLTGECIALLPK